MLEVKGLNVWRGATHVLKDVSFTVEAGELAALIGANGSGKSTTLLTLSGLLRARSGHAWFETVELTKATPEKIVRAGLIHCPEGRQIFQSLTVAENLAMGAYVHGGRVAPTTLAEIHALFPILKEREKLPAGTLSGGEQMMLAMARALIASPRLLLLDEPSLGLAPKAVEIIFDVIAALKARGIPILLIEQNAAMALEIADRAYVMEQGRIALRGSGAELANNDRVRQFYLGAAS